MGTQADKLRLFELLYEAREAALDEKAAAWDKLHAEIDRLRSGTSFSRDQVKELLYKDGYREYAKRRKLAERANP